MEISVLKFQAWPILRKNSLSYVVFLNEQRIFLVVTCLRLQFRSVGSGWQWISEGLNCVRFLFKFVTWKIGPLSHLNGIFSVLFLLCFRARLFNDALWSPAWKGLTSWLSFVCLIVKVSLSNLYPGSVVGLIVMILSPLSHFHVFPWNNIRKTFTVCIT